MKRCCPLILGSVVLVLNFLCFWYADVLFNRFFVLGVIPILIALVLLIVCAVLSVIRMIRGRERLQSVLSFILCVITVIIIAKFPFRMAKVKTELTLFEKDRLQVIEQIADDQLTPDGYRNLQLPRKYRRLSSDGTVHVYQNDEEQVICFWVFRGMLSGSVQLMYSSRDESLIWNNETVHPIESIEQLKEHWYLVNTDY
jgi:hypothetical protein